MIPNVGMHVSIPHSPVAFHVYLFGCSTLFVTIITMVDRSMVDTKRWIMSNVHVMQCNSQRVWVESRLWL